MGRALDMERHRPPEDTESSHTDHAPSAAAAPTPRACAGSVTECVKAQDSTDTISYEHHLSERVRHQDGLQWRQAGKGLHSKLPGNLLVTDLPTEAGALR